MVTKVNRFWPELGMLCMLAVVIPTAALAAIPPGTEIHASAKAQYTSAAGEVMPTATSNVAVVTVVYPTGLSIGRAKELADGQFVELAEAVVIGGTAEIGGAFYIEALNRSAGIRVATNESVYEGDMVIVAGTLATVEGERQINASDVGVMWSGSVLPEPLGMVRLSAPPGLDEKGLLARYWGRITAAPFGSGYFYIDDGTGLNDGSGYIGIRVRGVAPPDPIGKYVVVTGIAGAELLEDSPIRVVRTRRPEDISVVTGAP